MKYTAAGVFTTDQLSISETLVEVADVVQIAINNVKNCFDKKADPDLATALKNLDEAMATLPHIKSKVQKALAFVPDDVKKAEFL